MCTYNTVPQLHKGLTYIMSRMFYLGTNSNARPRDGDKLNERLNFLPHMHSGHNFVLSAETSSGCILSQCKYSGGFTADDPIYFLFFT